MSNENDTNPDATHARPEIPGGPAATPDTSEGREAAAEEGEEA